MFDNSHVTDDLVADVLACLRSSGVRTVVLPGNPDCLVPESAYVRHSFSDLAPNVNVILGRGGQLAQYPEFDLAVWVRPHADYADFSPPADVPPRGPYRWQIAAAHEYYVTDDSAYHVWKTTDADLESCKRDYVALGHIQNFSKVGTNGISACYSWSPRLTGAAVLVELDSGGIESISHHIP